MTNNAVAHIAGLTDVGQVRQINEDAILVDETIGLYAVADGMGGHGSGDVASQLALETLQGSINDDSVAKALASDNITDEQALTLVFQSIADVNLRIYEENVKRGQPDGTGMGTTLVGLCLFGRGKRAIAFNVGDSRLYEYRNQQLVQLTRDHTMYRDWEETGCIGPAPPRNIIMRAIGLFAEVDIDLDVLAVGDDTSYLLCSDGLSGMVSDEEITSALVESSGASAIVDSLIKRANEQGGVDNISVVALLHPIPQ